MENEEENPFLIDTDSSGEPVEDNPFMGGTSENDMDYQSRELGLPTPSRWMFAEMDDQDAQDFYAAYVNHPNSRVDEQGNVVYNGMAVPKPEGNSGIIGWMTGENNPEPWLTIGGDSGVTFGPDTGTENPYIPDAETAGAVVGSAINAGSNILHAGAELLDYSAPQAKSDFLESQGESTTPITDLADEYLPKYNPEGAVQHGINDVGEIAIGFALGNKFGAAMKTAGYAPKMIAAAEKMVPKLTGKIGNFLFNVAKNSTQGVGGMMVTTPSHSDTLVTGDTSALKEAGLESWVEGLPTDSDDAAQNAIYSRLNTGLDALITGAGISTAFQGLRSMFAAASRTKLGKMGAAFSNESRIKHFFQVMGDELKTVTGVESPEQLKQVWGRLVELVSNPKAQRLQGDLGVPGVQNIDAPLDVATTAARQIPEKSTDVIDTGIRTVLQGQAKKIQQKGYEQTAAKRETPVRELGRVLEETEEVFGKNDSVKNAASTIQDIGRKEVQAGVAESDKALSQSQDIADTITENVNRSDELRVEQMGKKYEAIDPTAKADMKSFNNVVEEVSDSLPKEVKDVIAKSNGSFASLNNQVKLVVNRYISELSGSSTLKERETVNALYKLKNNIEEDQIKFLEGNRAGGKFKKPQPEVAKQAQEAKDYAREEVYANRQGVSEDILNIEKKEAFQRDDIMEQSRQVLKKTIGNKELRESNARLEKILASEEGGKSEALLKRYKEARDKVRELDDIEDEVYGVKLKDFFERHKTKYHEKPMAPESFKELLEDPQGLNRVKEIIKLAKQEGEPVIEDALKSSWARKFKDKLYTGNVTALGGEKVSAPGVRAVVNDDAFMAAGKEIFSEHPGFIDVVQDTLKLANSIQRSSGLKAAAANWTDRVPETAKAGLKMILGPVYGPLSHRSLQLNTVWGAILEVLGPQGAMDRTADALLSDNKLFLKAYEELSKGGLDKKRVERATKIIVDAMIYNDGDRNKFEAAKKKWQTELETNKAFEK